ncbi:MAG: aldehyde ferredoxin oxidoreductase C-terminal domain-containing protein [Chloroflexota bacterium]
MTYGYNQTILWINLNEKSYYYEKRSEEFFRQYPGGGLLATRLLLEKTEAGIDPFSPHNLLIFTSSVVAGHFQAGLPRFTIAAKSPLTFGIGESRVEGPFGIALKASGADAIVISGAAEEPISIIIKGRQVNFESASHLWGLTVGETVDRLEKDQGSDIHVAAIGPAGENKVRFASIVTDRTYQASRMGPGAVMGSKKLKALVLHGGVTPSLADEERARQITNRYQQKVLVNPLTRWQKEPPGFSCWLYLHGVDCALCVNNYSRSTIAGIESYKEEEFLKRFRADGFCPGCPNSCIKFIHPLNDASLDERASGVHQEVTGTLGINLGILDLDWVLRANNLCNQYGLDPVSLGFTLSFAMELFERGILSGVEAQPVKFGDKDGAENLIMDIIRRRSLGDLFAEGTRLASQRIGNGAERYAMQVKGLEMVCFEPRSQTNLALGYAIAPIGPRYDICEHDWDYDTNVGWQHTMDLSRTVGILERIPMNYLGKKKVANFKSLITLWSGVDTLDLCNFATSPTRILSLPDMASMLAAVTGWETSDYEIMRMGEKRLHLMRIYNQREGITSESDILPDRFYEEAIESGPRKGDILDRQVFHQAVLMYYAMMGWNERGVPGEAVLIDHHLDWTIK